MQLKQFVINPELQVLQVGWQKSQFWEFGLEKYPSLHDPEQF
jgi:hypothetical protein